MPIIKPFRAVRYDATKVDLDAVVAPPYDVITAQQQNELYERHPNNVVRLILGREEDRYNSAEKFYRQWLKEGILLQDANPAIYYLVQTFELHGKQYQSKGVILRCKLEEFEKRIVLPHEKTLSKPREDRLKLLQLTDANFSQIFSFYSDPERSVDATLEPIFKADPFMLVSYEGVDTVVWNVTESTTVQAVAVSLLNKQVFIADGHHRYETGLLYRTMQKRRYPHHTEEKPYNYIMMYLTNMDQAGLVTLPTHRLVHGLMEFDRRGFQESLNIHFDCETFNEFAPLQRRLSEARQHSFGIFFHGDSSFYLVRLKHGAHVEELVGRSTPEVLAGLDVTLLHQAVLEKMLNITPEAQLNQTNLLYLHDAGEVLRSVRSGKAQIGFLMNPTRIEQVRSVATAGHVLPQKSTYFYPKLLSGLLINRLDD